MPLPLLDIRPDVNLPRKRRPGLRMQMPIRIRDAIRADLTVFDAIIHLHVLRARDVNDAVDNGMRDMDALGPEFARQALAQRARGEFARGEGAAEGGASHGCRSAGDQ